MDDRTSPGVDTSLLEALRIIRTTDPRFGWIVRDFGEEPDRRMDLLTLIDEQFVDLTDGERLRAALLSHLGAMIQDMRSLNPVQELFDITVPLVSEPHRLSVLLRRMGWSGEFWYTEQEAAFALGASLNHVRNERAKLVRALRKGPVWAPVLHRCAAVVQAIAPLSQTQFKAACGIDQEGKASMNLWGFLSALDIFGIDHWFHLEHVRTEPTIYCDVPLDFGYEPDILDDMVSVAERRIAREIALQRRMLQEERRERQRYLDPWDSKELRRSRSTDVGVRDAARIHWWEIPQHSALRGNPTYDASLYGGPLVTSRTLVIREQQKEKLGEEYPHDFDQETDVIEAPLGEQRVGTFVQVIDLFAGHDFGVSTETDELIGSGSHVEPISPELGNSLPAPDEPEKVGEFGAIEIPEKLEALEDEDDLEGREGDSSDLIDLVTLSNEDLIGHFTGLITETSVLEIERSQQDWTPIIDRTSSQCVGVVRTTRLRNKFKSGRPMIQADDYKLQGMELERFTSEPELDDALSRSSIVFFNDAPGLWGVIFRRDL